MERPIRLLHLEDDARDAELIGLRLETAGLRCEITWAHSRESFESALAREPFDLVLSDYNVPGYPGLAALRHVRQQQPDLPVIIISGGVSEEEAVDCLKSGATDYVLKQRPQRLDNAIKRALVEKEERAALRRAQEEISRQNAFLRQVIDADPNFIFVKDSDGRFVLANQAVADLYDTTVEAILGRTDADFGLHASEVEQFRAGDLQAMQTQREVWIPQERFTDRAGSTRWFQTFKRPLFSGQGVADRILGVAVDITARKRAEEEIRALNAELEVRVRDRTAELEAANRFLDSVIENIPDMIFIKDAADLRFVRFNRAGEQLLGHSRDELRGKCDYDFFPREEADFFTSCDREVLAQGALKDIAEEVIETRDNGTRLLHTKKIPLFDEHGRAHYLLGISEDITQAKEREREILRLNAALELRTAEADAANRAKSSFLATMSHEIRTPMNGMFGMLELLDLSELTTEQRATLQIVRESGNSLLRIIDDILDFSKIEAGKLEVRPEAASIHRIVASVKDMYAGNASSKGLLLRHSVDPRIGAALMVDPLRLGQILNNFVSNAIKFTARGAIDIDAQMIARADGREHVRILVRDTGVGISPEDQQRLFQPFNQVGGPAARQAGGTGLGLTICRRLAELMGGVVTMASEPGQGTTLALTLLLPIADLADLDTAESASTPVPAAFARGIGRPAADASVVLVVDDHPTNRMLLLRQMQILGYTADSAEDGGQALEKWRTGRFDLIVTDCHMPRMDGYELARAIRRIEAGERRAPIPIIACTANALPEEAARCKDAGMDECLVKPVQLSQLLKKLERHLPRLHAPAGPSGDPDPPGASAATDAAAPVDLALIAAHWGGDVAIVRKILADFRAFTQADAAKLRQAMAAGDMSQVTHSAHRMLGASSMVGARGLALACEQIDHASRAGHLNAVEAGMLAFARELERLEAYFNSPGTQAG
jgi:PAS domain S-box-containing protein